MKRVLIHTLIFSPDGVSTAYLYNDIALAFQKAGYEVVVLTATPHFNLVEEQLKEQPLRWLVPGICKVSDFHGIRVYHVPQKKFKSTLLRVLGFAYWHVVSFFIGLCIKKINVIVSPSPPLTIGRLNNWLGKLKGCKVVYNVQEIYPDIMGKPETSIVTRYLRGMEKRVYDRSDAVTTIDQVFYDTIAPRFKDAGKLHIIPNFVDTELYNPSASTEGLDKSLFPETDAKKVLYAGNIGYAQDWDTLISLAEKTKEDAIDYFIIGEGVTKAYLEEKVAELGLTKVHVLPYQARNLMPSILAYSDVQFIFMSRQMEHQGFPSKIYTIMACGKPVMISSARDTSIVKFLEGTGCAKIVDRDVEALAEFLRGSSMEDLAAMGKKGLEVIEQNYSKEIVTRKYVELIESL